MDESLAPFNISNLPFEMTREPVPSNPLANPYRVVVDPAMRVRLRKALGDLIDSHDAELSKYISEGSLGVENYKEYVEMIARSLRDTLASKEGVSYLLEAIGFDIDPDTINLNPETRWRVTRDDLEPVINEE